MMKLPDNASKTIGRCYVCGKSTKLFIHQPCGEKLDAIKRTTLVGKEGYRFTLLQQERHRHNQAKKRYAEGYVPKFCFT